MGESQPEYVWKGRIEEEESWKEREEWKEWMEVNEQRAMFPTLSTDPGKVSPFYNWRRKVITDQFIVKCYFREMELRLVLKVQRMEKREFAPKRP